MIDSFNGLAIDNTLACDPMSVSPAIITLPRDIGRIVSPSYSKFDFHPTNRNCSWTIVAPEEYKIWIDFETVLLDRNHEGSISFYDGQDEKGALVERITGWGTKRKFHSLRNAMHIKFRGIVDESKVSRTSPQFSFWYVFVKPPQKCDEQRGEKQCNHNLDQFSMVNLPNKCYMSEHECDGIDFCGDGTDEENCTQNALSESGKPVDPFNDFPEGCGMPSFDPSLLGMFFKIKGGNRATPGSWPWQVSLRLNSFEPEGHSCGAVLLNRNWVATAAHCFSQIPEFSNPKMWSVHMGRFNKILRNHDNELVRYIELIEYHPNWTLVEADFRLRLRYDIALIKLNAPLPTNNKYVRPVCLPESDFIIEDRSFGVVTGWGDVHGTGFDLVLKQAAVPVVPERQCQEWYPLQPIDESVICAGFGDGNRDSCDGDSGGPLVSRSKDGRWRLAGIVASGGPVCGSRNKPGIYTRVSYFVDWIYETIKNDAHVEIQPVDKEQSISNFI